MTLLDKPTYIVCKLCSSDNLRVTYCSKRNGWSIYSCRDCGLRFVSIVFSREEQGNLYQGGMAASLAEAERSVAGAPQRLKTLAKRLAQYVSRESLMLCPVRKKILDVGCGAGDFLAEAREEGFDVHGQEISLPAAQIAAQCHGLKVDTREIEAFENSEIFDAVSLIGVLEHVLDPKAMLKRVHRLLAPGGVLLIYTPVWGLYDNIFSFVARVSRGRITLPIDRRINAAHLQILQHRTLVRALEDLGMMILSYEEVCEYHLPIGCYVDSVGVTRRRLKNAAARIVQGLVDRRLFFRNNMKVFARKTDNGRTPELASQS